MGGMTPAPQDPTLAPWMSLQEPLAGYLAARARGLLASDFVLSGREGEELGWLRVHGRRGADLEAGEEGALPLAVFLLYRIIMIRRRAFLMGTERGNGSSP